MNVFKPPCEFGPTDPTEKRDVEAESARWLREVSGTPIAEIVDCINRESATSLQGKT